MLSDSSSIIPVFAEAEYRKAISRPLGTDAAIGYALTKLMCAVNEGYACAVLLDRTRRHLATVTLKKNGKMEGETVIELIKRAVERYSPAFLLIAHNHPHDELSPSGADIFTTELVRDRFQGDKLTFIDHFIISGNRWDTVLNGNYRECYMKQKEVT